MFWLRVFALGLLLAPATSAFAAPLMPSSTPTMEDVDPGIDHTGRDRDLPPELRRQSVYYRTEQPAGTIIVNTHDRFLYLIMGTGLLYDMALASAAMASSGAACTTSAKKRSGRTGRRRPR
jgi:lipoprotein-anchoring transpeptidase ErfK/SrfK